MTITIENMVQQIKDMSDGEEYVYVCDEDTGVVKIIRKVLTHFIGYTGTAEGYFVHNKLLDEHSLLEYIKETW